MDVDSLRATLQDDLQCFLFASVCALVQFPFLLNKACLQTQ